MTDDEMRKRVEQELQSAGIITIDAAAKVVAAVRRGEMTLEQVRERIPVTATYEQLAAQVDRYTAAVIPACEHKEAVYGCGSCVARVRAKYPEYPVLVDRDGKARPGPTSIPWAVAEKAWQRYAQLYGTGQSVERMAQRGGFYWSELDSLFPGWREATDEWVRLRAELAARTAERDEWKTCAEREGARAEQAERERDELRESRDMERGLVGAVERERDTLRERVGVLEEREKQVVAVLRGAAAQAKSLEMRVEQHRRGVAPLIQREHATTALLAAIRQRAGEWVGRDEQRRLVMAHILGDDAPAPIPPDGERICEHTNAQPWRCDVCVPPPSELDGLRGERVEVPTHGGLPKDLSDAANALEPYFPGDASRQWNAASVVWGVLYRSGWKDRSEIGRALASEVVGAGNATACALRSGARRLGVDLQPFLVNTTGLASAPQTDDLSAVEQWRENQEAVSHVTPHEPTVAEAFATVRGHHSAIAVMMRRPEDREQQRRVKDALSLLECRMGAMELAARAVLEFFPVTTEGPRKHSAEAQALASLRAALTVAPPVFTPEQVEQALVSTGIGPVAREQVRACLLSLRVKP